MRVCIGIVAHPQRKHMADELADQVSAAIVAVDDHHRGCTANHLEAWKYLSTHDSDWTVILEDDAQPTDNFRHQLHQALDHAPRPVVSLYLGTSRPPQWQPRIGDAIAKAQANDAAWITSTHLLHAVGVAIPTRHITTMLAFVTAKPVLPIDEGIGQWARMFYRQHATPIAYTVPSLIDHADGPSYARHRDSAPRNKPRKAWTVGNRNTWTTQTVTM